MQVLYPQDRFPNTVAWRGPETNNCHVDVVVVGARGRRRGCGAGGGARAAKRAKGERLNRQHTAVRDDAVRAAEEEERAAKEAAKAARLKEEEER